MCRSARIAFTQRNFDTHRQPGQEEGRQRQQSQLSPEQRPCAVCESDSQFHLPHHNHHRQATDARRAIPCGVVSSVDVGGCWLLEFCNILMIVGEERTIRAASLVHENV